MLALACVFCAQSAVAQTIQIQVNAREIYAERPFVLNVGLAGFDESPEPQLSEVIIPGATVEYVGMNPSVSSMVTVVNGRRTDTRDVTFWHQYKVTVPNGGDYVVSPISATQGTRSAISQQGTFTATAIESTDKMAIRFVPPARPVVVGETFEAYVDWYLQADPENQEFEVPFFQREDVRVKAPPGDGTRQQRVAFDVKGEQIAVPFQQEKAVLDGREYTRVRFQFEVMVTASGDVQIPASRVFAKLPTGKTRDRFNRVRNTTTLFKATDREQVLNVGQLPQLGRPESFSNALGTSYSIAVEASRTVVKMGDPVELTVTISGDGELDGLILPPLSADGGLSTDLFSLPSTPPTGEVITTDDGRSAKRFKVDVRVKSERTSEIPPIAFSFYNPKTSRYETVRSQPIALSVAGANVVGASDVVGSSNGNGTGKTRTANGTQRPSSEVSLIGVDLGLSDASQTLRSVTTISDMTPFILALYLLPLALLGFMVWRTRGADARAERGARKGARRDIDAVLAEARGKAAKAATAELSNALRSFARSAGYEGAPLDKLVERIEVEGFNPSAADQPLPGELLDDVAAFVEGLDRETASASRAAAAAMLLLIALAGTMALPTPAAAQDLELDEARDLYAAALAEDDRARRTQAFARAEAVWATLGERFPDRPELLVDWGNAALGAQNFGNAVLAYRRALAADPHNPRAQQNLEWTREQLPDWLPKPEAEAGATESFFVLNRFLDPATRGLLGAGVFAIFVLLLVPWGTSSSLRRGLRWFAVAPFVVWIWLTASLFFDRPVTHDGVIVADGSVLRTGDAEGAAAALDEPLPGGAEVAVLEQRDGWTRVALADGSEGWVRSSAVARVTPQ